MGNHYFIVEGAASNLDTEEDLWNYTKVAQTWRV